jgi:hypothetical protein
LKPSGSFRPAELRKVMNPDIGIALIDLDRSES